MQHDKRIETGPPDKQLSASEVAKSDQGYPWGGPALTLFVMSFLIAHEPALANKFETIGSGIGGSRQLKLDWLQGFLYTVGGLSLLSGILAITFPHNNSLFLNATNWKQSATILFIFSGISFTGGFLL